VELDKAAALLCPDDGVSMYVIADPKAAEVTPALRCMICDTTIRPGLDLWKQIENVVLEHYDREKFN
jgi:hypothetical protein